MSYVRTLSGLFAAVLAIVIIHGCGKREPKVAAHDTGQEIVGEPAAVVATVGDEKVTLAELNLLASYWTDQSAPEMRRTLVKSDLQRRALSKLIEQLLLVAEAERRGFSVADTLVQKRLKDWESLAGGDGTLGQRLERSHVSRETVAEHLRRDALIQKMVEALTRDSLAVSDETVRAYYDEHPEYFDNLRVRASHILLNLPPGSPPESVTAVESRIRALHERLKRGEDFAAVARKYSQCPSAPQGGDLGLTGRGQWVKPFEEAAFSLPAGQMSAPVRTDFGYHIIKVTEVQAGSAAPFESVRNAIAQFLRNAQVQELVDRLATRLRAQAEIHEYIGGVSAEG